MMRLFGQRKTTSWEVASSQIATAFLDLRKEFYHRCLEALDWHVSRGIIGAPRSVKALSGHAEQGAMAFQIWTARVASFRCSYLDDEKADALFSDLAPRVCGSDDETYRQVVIDEVVRFHELCANPEFQNIHLASLFAAHLYGEPDNQADRELAVGLFTILVPSFSFRLRAAFALAFGDMKTAKRMKFIIRKFRVAGVGY
jgi:hypothetical protein